MTDKKGANNGNAKLTQEQVEQIRAIWATHAGKKKVPREHPFSMQSLADHFGVTKSHMYKIVTGRRWE